MTATPRLDAVTAWVAGGRVGDIDWPEERQPLPRAVEVDVREKVGQPAAVDPLARARGLDWPDPPEWIDPTRSLDAVLAMASSGAPAELPIAYAIVHGRKIPAPPNQRPRPRRKKYS